MQALQRFTRDQLGKCIKIPRLSNRFSGSFHLGLIAFRTRNGRSIRRDTFHIVVIF
jgi:hypothetical protein